MRKSYKYYRHLKFTTGEITLHDENGRAKSLFASVAGIDLYNGFVWVIESSTFVSVVLTKSASTKCKFNTNMATKLLGTNKMVDAAAEKFIDANIKRFTRNVRDAETSANLEVSDSIAIRPREEHLVTLPNLYKTMGYWIPANVLSNAASTVTGGFSTVVEDVVEDVIEDVVEDVIEEPKEFKIKETTKAPGSFEALISKTVVETINEAGFSEFLNDRIGTALKSANIKDRKLEISVRRIDTNSVINTGINHFKFEEVLACVAGGVNTALVGPAGSGKTTTVKKAATALGLRFFAKSVSTSTAPHEFFGYMDATGNYVSTLFREAYENGGVFLLDEFDAGNPNVLAALNAATANGECAFADAMVPKHDDFVIFMAGNTYGHGATIEYVGRNRIDAATLDRFAFISFPYDEALEMELANNKEWCSTVVKLRHAAAAKNIRTIISPRATFNGDKLLKAGLSRDKVLELLVFKGLDSNEVSMLKSAL